MNASLHGRGYRWIPHDGRKDLRKNGFIPAVTLNQNYSPDSSVKLGKHYYLLPTIQYGELLEGPRST